MVVIMNNVLFVEKDEFLILGDMKMFKFRATLEVDIYIEDIFFKHEAIEQADKQIELIKQHLPNSYLRSLTLLKRGERFVNEDVTEESLRREK